MYKLRKKDCCQEGIIEHLGTKYCRFCLMQIKEIN